MGIGRLRAFYRKLLRVAPKKGLIYPIWFTGASKLRPLMKVFGHALPDHGWGKCGVAKRGVGQLKGDNSRDSIAMRI